LLHHTSFHIGRELPAARVVEHATGGYRALLPDRWLSYQEVSVAELLDAAFGGRLKFGLPQGFATLVSVWGNDAECWSCHRHGRVITHIAIHYGPHESRLTIPDLSDHREIFDTVRERLPEALNGTAIKDRYSQMQERSYLSNGCVHCGKLFGEFHATDYLGGETKVGEFITLADAAWCRAIAAHEDPDFGAKRWGVYRRL
jgi:competence protein CoiA